MLITIERRASCSMFARSCKHSINAGQYLGEACRHLLLTATCLPTFRNSASAAISK